MTADDTYVYVVRANIDGTLVFGMCDFYSQYMGPLPFFESRAHRTAVQVPSNCPRRKRINITDRCD